jgi:hypothetical protein
MLPTLEIIPPTAEIIQQTPEIIQHTRIFFPQVSVFFRQDVKIIPQMLEIIPPTPVFFPLTFIFFPQGCIFLSRVRISPFAQDKFLSAVGKSQQRDREGVRITQRNTHPLTQALLTLWVKNRMAELNIQLRHS